MSKCSNSGAVTATPGAIFTPTTPPAPPQPPPNAYAGGVVGVMRANADVTACYNTGYVKASGDDADKRAGGVAGYSGNSGRESSEAAPDRITACYNTGRLDTSGTGQSYMGGLVGWNDNSVSIITGCYWLDLSGDSSLNPPSASEAIGLKSGSSTSTTMYAFGPGSWPSGGLWNDAAYWKSRGSWSSNTFPKLAGE